ncbi:MAG: phosphoadenylyl-sulfate reductase [Puniceicoccales bacterium]
MPIDPDQIQAWNQKLETLPAHDRIRWAINTFSDKLVATSSFGLQAAICLHLLTQNAPGIPIIFVDTGYLFRETYQYVETLQQLLRFNLHSYHAKTTTARQEALYGKLWERGLKGLEQYLEMNKLEPMRRALSELGSVAWISGIRRTQASTREDRSIIEQQGGFIKIHPLIDWSDKQVEAYFESHNLPRHPLSQDGYVSLGDWHSTTKLGAGQPAEATRFRGLKRECGLHDNAKWKANQ